MPIIEAVFPLPTETSSLLAGGQHQGNVTIIGHMRGCTGVQVPVVFEITRFSRDRGRVNAMGNERDVTVPNVVLGIIVCLFSTVAAMFPSLSALIIPEIGLN